MKEHNYHTEIEIARSLLSSWQQESLPSEHFERVDVASQIIGKAMAEGSTLKLITPLCLNYETFRINSIRRPTIHAEMTVNDRGLRRGYVLLHEEIPHRLSELQRLGIPIQYVVTMMDEGISKQIFSDRNAESEGRNLTELKYLMNSVIDQNTQKVRELILHGLSVRNISNIEVCVDRLTSIASRVPDNGFYTTWNWWNRQIYDYLQSENTVWGKMVRTSIRQDSAYMRDAWGYTSDAEIRDRIINELFGLTSAYGDALPLLWNAAGGHPVMDKSDVILLDAIPGPKNPAHKEFICYNMHYPSGELRKPTGILRPFHNLVLLSDPAVEVGYLNKSLDELNCEREVYKL